TLASALAARVNALSSVGMGAPQRAFDPLGNNKVSKCARPFSLIKPAWQHACRPRVRGRRVTSDCHCDSGKSLAHNVAAPCVERPPRPFSGGERHGVGSKEFVHRLLALI